MRLDILAALEAAPARGSRSCGVAQFLDGIPADTAGRDELVRLVETKYDSTAPDQTRSGQNMAKVLTALGFEVTQNPIHDHRNHACRCYR